MSGLAAWAGQYIGLRFSEHGRIRQDGVDCWGLARLIWQEQFGLAVPSYVDAYESTLAEDQLGRLVRGELGPWRPVAGGQEQPGDGVLIRMRGQPMHVAVVAGGGRMVHVEQGIDSVLEVYGDRRWRHRVLGFYRHEAMP